MAKRSAAMQSLAVLSMSAGGGWHGQAQRRHAIPRCVVHAGAFGLDMPPAVKLGKMSPDSAWKDSFPFSYTTCYIGALLLIEPFLYQESNPMKKTFRNAVCSPIVIVLVVFQTGCATIINTPMKSIRFTSEPGNAIVMIDGAPTGRTPCALMLKRRHGHDVQIKKKGYQACLAHVSRTGDGWIFGNILLGGIIGIIVDLATGSCWGLSPEQIHCELVGEGEAIEETVIEAEVIEEAEIEETNAETENEGR